MGDEGEQDDILVASSLTDSSRREEELPAPGVTTTLKSLRAQANSFDESPINTAPAFTAGLTVPDPAPDEPTGTPPVWKAELDQRVETFRRRRARTKGASGSNPNLEFDFEEPPAEAAPLAAEAPMNGQLSAGPEIDFDGTRTAPAGPVEMGSIDVRPSPPPVAIPVLESRVATPDPRPVGFVLDSAPARPYEGSKPLPVEIHLAPMTQRIVGGLIDAAVLAVSAGVFALIFWRAGGHVSSHPLTLFVMGFVVIFMGMMYFGAFTAIIAATPGLLWMGIEVRSLAGGPPTVGQAIWRAFGCLVSASALLLGFAWALLDSESLTWHDRMSDTYLAPAEPGTHDVGLNFSR